MNYAVKTRVMPLPASTQLLHDPEHYDVQLRSAPGGEGSPRPTICPARGKAHPVSGPKGCNCCFNHTNVWKGECCKGLLVLSKFLANPLTSPTSPSALHFSGRGRGAF